jgi:Recombinase
VGAKADLGARTRAALRVKRAQGVQLGRPGQVGSRLRKRIRRMREQFDDRGRPRSLASIAAALNAEGVPTARGGARWYSSTVRAILGGAGP